ncbi:MAG: hypothetical protein ACM3XO_23200 [Bacteroidota bacterium]
MQSQKSHFHRNLSIVLLILFGLTLATLSYFIWAVEGNHVLRWEMLLNVLILSLPLVLIYGAVYVLLMGWHERSALGKVSPRLAGLIHWAPRIAAILIILFTGLFSLDVFGEGGSPLQVLEAFFMHNIPSIAMLLVLVFAWKRPVVGFVAFLVVAAAFILFFVRDIYALTNLALFVLPLFLIAFLFYADWQWVKV